MKLLRVLLPLFLFGGTLSAELVETADISDVAHYIDNHTWVVLDIDNTLIRTAQQLGSPQWTEHLLEELIANGATRAEAAAQVLKRWGQVHRLTRVELVDPRSLQLIGALHAGRVPVVAVTGRLPRYADITERELESVGLSLGKTAPLATRSFEQLAGQPEYRAGIFHIGVRLSKAEALKAFLAALARKPLRLVVVDDSATVLAEIEEMFLAQDIECIAIHYVGAKSFVEAFDPAIAQKQWETLGRVLSDDEVRRLEGDVG